MPLSQTTKFKRIPVTRVELTLLDLAAALGPDMTEVALDCALRRRITTVARVERTLQVMGGQGHCGTALIRKLLKERPSHLQVSASPLETIVARALAESGLPPPTPQFSVLRDGRLLGRVDFAWPWARVALEVDGYTYHHGRSRWKADLARRNALAEAGWTLVHATVDDVRRKEDRAEIVARVRAFLTPRL